MHDYICHNMNGQCIHVIEGSFSAGHQNVMAAECGDRNEKIYRYASIASYDCNTI